MVYPAHSQESLDRPDDDLQPFRRAHAYLTQLDPSLIDRLSPGQLTALADLQHQFDLDHSRLESIVDRFQHEFNVGLKSHTRIPQTNGSHPTDPPPTRRSSDHSSEPDEDRDRRRDFVNLPMLPTFIYDVPRGDESGLFLALDLGGTNLRVCQVSLNGDKTFEIQSHKYLLTDQLKTGSAEALFEYIADCVEAFLVQMGHVSPEQDEKLYLGFTFSFPVLQSALAEGRLIDWTKGFNASGAVGRDVVKLLQSALDQKQLHVHCNALVNDTVGTLMARAYQSGSALVGAIFGTGTNAAYVERLSAVTKLDLGSPDFQHVDKMIINTEWGAFDNQRNVLPITKYDNKLDRESINPRKQTFEKLVSGMYLGEVTRNVIVDLIDRGLLFEGHSTRKLNRHYGFDTSLMSQIDGGGLVAGREDDNQKCLEQLKKIEHLMRDHFELDDHIGALSDWIVIERVCEVVATRAARLSAAAIATVIKQTRADQSADDEDHSKISIGVDGSLIERYDKFIDRIQRGLRDIFIDNDGDEHVYRRIEIELAKDGSGVGAALCALQAKKQADSLLVV